MMRKRSQPWVSSALRALGLLSLSVLVSACTVTRYSTTSDGYGYYDAVPNPPVYIYRDIERGSRFRPAHPRRDAPPPPHRLFPDWRHREPRGFYPEYGLRCDPRRAVCYTWDERHDRWRPDRSETRDYFGKKAAKRLTY